MGESKFNLKNLTKLEPDFKHIRYESGFRVGAFDEKNSDQESRATVPFKC